MEQILKELHEKLPVDKKEKKKLRKMFESFDNNGNGYLSLAEIDSAF